MDQGSCDGNAQGRLSHTSHRTFLCLPGVQECPGKASVVTSPATKYIPAADVSPLCPVAKATETYKDCLNMQCHLLAIRGCRNKKIGLEEVNASGKIESTPA